MSTTSYNVVRPVHSNIMMTIMIWEYITIFHIKYQVNEQCHTKSDNSWRYRGRAFWTFGCDTNWPWPFSFHLVGWWYGRLNVTRLDLDLSNFTLLVDGLDSLMSPDLTLTFIISPYSLMVWTFGCDLNWPWPLSFHLIRWWCGRLVVNRLDLDLYHFSLFVPTWPLPLLFHLIYWWYGRLDLTRLDFDLYHFIWFVDGLKFR